MNPRISFERGGAPRVYTRTHGAIAGFAAVIALLLSIISITGSTASRLAVTLGSRLGGDITVGVWGRGLESADAATARAVEVIAVQPGVLRVVALEPDKTDAYIGKLLARRPPGMEGPRLISISHTATTGGWAPGLRALFIANRLVAAVDDHRDAESPLEQRAYFWAGLAVAAGVVLCVVYFVLCWLLGAGQISAGAERFELMVRLGASPSFVGASVGKTFGLPALAGAALGAGCIAGIPAIQFLQPGIWYAFGWLEVARPEFRDALWSATWLMILPAIAALAGGLGARSAFIRASWLG